MVEEAWAIERSLCAGRGRLVIELPLGLHPNLAAAIADDRKPRSGT
jgi:hypothetical protein